MSCKTDFNKYLTLTFILKVIIIFLDVCSNQHMICKYSGEYDQPQSK